MSDRHLESDGATARIAIDSRPFIDFLRHLGTRRAEAQRIRFLFKRDGLEVEGARITGVFPGEGTGRLEVVLGKRQVRWLSGISVRRLPPTIRISATACSLSIEKETLSWGTQDVPADGEGMLLKELDLLTAYHCIQSARLKELGLLSRAESAHRSATDAIRSAQKALSDFYVGPEDLEALLQVKIAGRLKHWHQTRSPLAAESATHPRKRAPSFRKR